MGPTIEKLADRYAGKVKVCKLNIDNAPKLKAKYGVQGIPCVILFNGGEPIKSFEGIKPEAEYAKAINGVLAKK